MDIKTHARGRESNAYASVAYADSYLTTIYGAGNLGTWSALSADQKKYRLINGAAVLGLFPLRGYRSYIGQSMDFPRIIPNDARWDGKTVPQDVIDASVLTAYLFVHRELTSEASPDEGVSAGRVSEVSLGGLLSVKFAERPLVGGTLLNALIRSLDFPIIQKLRPFISQVRSKTSRTTTERSLLEVATYTTTTTIPVPTTTTIPVTTTTVPVTTTTSV